MTPRYTHWLLALGAAALTACSSPAPAPSTTTPATLSAIQRKALAPALYELAYSPRQHAVYAVSAGGFGEGAPSSQLLKLDPQTLTIQSQVALSPRGFGIALDDQANRLYIGQGLDASITVLDTRTLQPIGRVQLAEKIQGDDGKDRYEHHFRQLVLDPTQQRLYAPGLSTGDSALYVVDTQALKVDKVLRGLGQVATGVSLDAQGQRLFVSNLRGGLYEVDTRTLTLRQSYAVGADQLLNLWFDAQGQRLFATDQGLETINARRQKIEPDFVPTPGNRVVVFNPDSGAITASLPTGEGPIALLHDDQRHRLFVTNRGAGTVTVFDTRSLQPLQTIELPDHPNSLALDAVHNVLYVSIKNGREAERGSPESIARIAF